mmetsp:Transcript_129763/g.276929  ORF Transcript_129763/g.276929 Transcript_129763/m.276929 type:complete len:91 (-) Transcript_129763:457-729(-)
MALGLAVGDLGLRASKACPALLGLDPCNACTGTAASSGRRERLAFRVLAPPELGVPGREPLALWLWFKTWEDNPGVPGSSGKRDMPIRCR